MGRLTLLAERASAYGAALVFLIALGASLAPPLFSRNWYDGTLIATLHRVLNGGRFYSSPDSALLDATSPYLPGNLLLLNLLAEALPDAITILPRACGIFFCILLYLLICQLCVKRFGIPSPVAIAFTAFVFSSLLNNGSFQFLTFFPDFAVVATAVIAVSLVESTRSASAWPRIALVSILLCAMLLLKQSGVALAAGLLAYILLHDGLQPTEKRAWIGAMLFVSAATATILYFFPGVREYCFQLMGRHSFRTKEFITRDIPSIIGAFWPLYALGFVAVCRATLRTEPATSARRPVWMLACLLVPLAGVQLLSALKVGGGSYNANIIAVLVIPLALSALMSLAMPWQARAMLTASFALAAILASTLSIYSSMLDHRSQTPQFRSAVEYLRYNFPNAKVLYGADNATVVLAAGLVPLTDLFTLSHFTAAGVLPGQVVQAIKSQKYDLVYGLQDRHSWREMEDGKRHWGQLEDLVMRYYQEPQRTEIPALLHGKLLVRRPKPEKGF